MKVLSRILAVFVIFAFALLLSCGRSARISFGKGANQIAQGLGYESPGIEKSGSLKVPVHFDYDYSRFPSEAGFAVVPMQDDRTPCLDAAGNVSLSVRGTAERPVVEIVANGLGAPTVHFRYNPEKWQIAGVGSASDSGKSDDFLFADAIAEPGVLVIHKEPKWNVTIGSLDGI